MDETQNPTPMNPNPMSEPETPSNGDGDGGQPMDGGAQMPPASTPMDGVDENENGGVSE